MIPVRAPFKIYLQNTRYEILIVITLNSNRKLEVKRSIVISFYLMSFFVRHTKENDDDDNDNDYNDDYECDDDGDTDDSYDDNYDDDD